MGTRADFYVRRDREKLEQKDWLGSIAWDGYPDGIDEAVLNATTEPEFRSALAAFATGRKDWTAPRDGWPWPWSDSGTTDYAYVFEGGEVTWHEEPEDGEAPPLPDYPDMKSIQRVTLGGRSGLIVMSAGQPPNEEGK